MGERNAPMNTEIGPQTRLRKTVSRSGLFRAAALLAAGAAPLLTGSANAVEVPQLAGVPDVGADKLITDATQHADPLDQVGSLKLGQVKAPVVNDVQAPQAPEVPAAQERTTPLAPELDVLPALPNPEQLVGGSDIGGVQAPKVSDLPAGGVISGTLPTING
jgi:hypothetical protein